MEPSYKHWGAISDALLDTGSRRSDIDRNQIIDSAVFDRFLVRVFHADRDERWLLKGGTSMLARVPNARVTHDIDLAALRGDIHEAVDALRAAVEIDLDDHLRFRFHSSRGLANLGADRGQKVSFLMFRDDRNAPLRKVSVDVVTEHAPIGRIETFDPANRINLKRPLVTVPFRYYPSVDHTADKTSATMAEYRSGRSTRAKDLVDLVIFADTEEFSLRELARAIDYKFALNDIQATALSFPEEWEDKYEEMAEETPACRVEAFSDAVELAHEFLGPALEADWEQTTSSVWVPGQRAWVPESAVRSKSVGGGRSAEVDTATALWLGQYSPGFSGIDGPDLT